MGFLTLAGRLLFAAAFFLGVWLKFIDEETYLQKLEPATAILRSYLTSMGAPRFELQAKYLLSTGMVIQGLGASLFLFGSSFGVYLMLIFMVAGIIVCDFAYPIKNLMEEVLKHLSIVGALLLFLGMKNQAALNSKKKDAVKVKAA